MTILEAYPDDRPTEWWKNFDVHIRANHKKSFHVILQEQGCRFVARSALEFENDADATAFLLRWS